MSIVLRLFARGFGDFWPVILIWSFVVVTFTSSFVSSFLRAWMRSDSLIFRVEMFVIVVVSGIRAASTANVMTRSGVWPMSMVPSGFGFGVPVISRMSFVCFMWHPIFLRYSVKKMSPWIEFFGRFFIVIFTGFWSSIDLRIAYSPRYEADDASFSIWSWVGLYFWFGAIFIVRKFFEVSTFIPHFFIKAIVISMYGRDKRSPVIWIVSPFCINGLERSREVMYWLEMLPGILIFPPVRVDGLMLIGGQPLFVSRFASSCVSTSVRGLIGRSFIRFSPVITTSLLRQQARVVMNLTAVPALPRWIFPGDFVLSFLRPSRR